MSKESYTLQDRARAIEDRFLVMEKLESGWFGDNNDDGDPIDPEVINKGRRIVALMEEKYHNIYPHLFPTIEDNDGGIDEASGLQIFWRTSRGSMTCDIYNSEWFEVRSRNFDEQAQRFVGISLETKDMDEALHFLQEKMNIELTTKGIK